MTTNVHFEQARAVLDRWAKHPEQLPAISDVFECHIFCAPLDPDDATKQRFVESCKRVGIKALCLGLDYEDKGVVNVLQSTKYYSKAGPREPIELMLRDAEALAEDFEVVRLKLEAMATNPGVPKGDAGMRELTERTGFDGYFEYHVKLGGLPVSPENDERLKRLAGELTHELGVKIPFSCNNMGAKNQRFLNARTYGLGYDASRQVPLSVARAAEKRGFETRKIIEEFIVFDTNKELDRGWLEF